MVNQTIIILLACGNCFVCWCWCIWVGWGCWCFGATICFCPCIFLLIVFASAIAKSVAPETDNAFTTFVANGFKSLNANCLALVALSKLVLLF